MIELIYPFDTQKLCMILHYLLYAPVENAALIKIEELLFSKFQHYRIIIQINVYDVSPT